MRSPQPSTPPAAATKSSETTASAGSNGTSKTIPRAQLLERAFGFDYEGLERTADVHVRNLRKKINDDPNAPRYIETVYGVGYRAVDHDVT